MKSLEVQVRSLQKKRLVSFLNKFDFERMYCVLGEMLKYFKQFNPIDGFDMFIQLSFRMFKYLLPSKPHRKLPNEIVVMRSIFGALQKGIQYIRIKSDIHIQIKFKDITPYAYYFYHLFVSAFLPK